MKFGFKEIVKVFILEVFLIGDGRGWFMDFCGFEDNVVRVCLKVYLVSGFVLLLGGKKGLGLF